MKKGIPIGAMFFTVMTLTGMFFTLFGDTPIPHGPILGQSALHGLFDQMGWWHLLWFPAHRFHLPLPFGTLNTRYNAPLLEKLFVVLAVETEPS